MNGIEASCAKHPGDNCTPEGCVVMGEAKMLEDRVETIEFLANAAREGVLAGCGQAPDCAGGMSLTAALETIRILAGSITHESMLLVPGETRVRWNVLKPRRLAKVGRAS